MTDSKDERKANRKERKGAKELLRIGNKAWLYRRDRLPPIEEQLSILQTKAYENLSKTKAARFKYSIRKHAS